jgi:hypothetical protein
MFRFNPDYAIEELGLNNLGLNVECQGDAYCAKSRLTQRPIISLFQEIFWFVGRVPKK